MFVAAKAIKSSGGAEKAPINQWGINKIRVLVYAWRPFSLLIEDIDACMPRCPACDVGFSPTDIVKSTTRLALK